MISRVELNESAKKRYENWSILVVAYSGGCKWLIISGNVISSVFKIF